MLLESSVTLLENICSTGVTHDDHNMFIAQAMEMITCEEIMLD
jgi:hypothetical protein